MSCLNPITNRLIKINGPTYNKLVRDGYKTLLDNTLLKIHIERYLPLLDIFDMNILILNQLNDKDYVHLSMTNYKALEFYNNKNYIYERYLHQGGNPSLTFYIHDYFYFKNTLCNRDFVHGDDRFYRKELTDGPFKKSVINIYQIYHPWELSKIPKWLIKLNGVEVPYDYNIYDYINNQIIYNGIIYHQL